jgi:2-polyprenyl-3-methyl-5-hydroxy-6-metoxy-1,4-benzoquinol methylase
MKEPMISGPRTGFEIVDAGSHELYEEMLSTHLSWYYGDCLGLSEEQVGPAIAKRLRRERGTELARFIDELVGLAGARLLDVGSGWGELALACTERGALTVGVEPDATEVRISELLFRSFGLAPTVSQGVGERLPHADETFDLVTCQQVLEHVDDVGQVVSELVRVTKPAGHIFVSTPNYLFPYEGHYRLKWFPFMPKQLGAWVLRRKGKDPTFLLQHVNYTNYIQLSALWRKHGLVARNLTEERLRTGSHPGEIYRRPVVRFVASKLRLYPNISWLLTKPSPSAQRRQ